MTGSDRITANSPVHYEAGLSNMRRLVQPPFEYGLGYLISDTFEDGTPGIVSSHEYPDVEEVDFQGISMGLRSGFLSELRWPGYNSKEMAIEDDTPTARYILPWETTPSGIRAQLSVHGVLDPGILGPFSAGWFIWDDQGRVIFYDDVIMSLENEMGPNSVMGVMLSDLELFNLNRAISHSFNSAFETRRMNVASVLSHLVHR